MTNKNTNLRQNQDNDDDANRDPITGAPGSHPLGTGVGAAGAAIGSIGGPVGAAVGLVAGAVAGGLAGKSIAVLALILRLPTLADRKGRTLNQ